MHKLLLILLLCLILPFAAHAKEDKEVRDCRRALEKDTAIYWELLRQMADFRAAIDAGYEGCVQSYPEKFAGAEEYFTYWQENTEIEFEQAFEVAYVLAEGMFNELDHECGDKEALLDALKERSRDAIDGQYEKAHQRRLKALTGDGLSGTGENAFLDFDENDSCKHVLTSLESYRKYHGSRKQAQFALYTFATEHSSMANLRDRETKDALRDFVNERKKITFSAFGN
jgi:hypothetical protein